MTQMELRLVVAIGKFCLREADNRVRLTKLVVAQGKIIMSARTDLSRLERLPDSDEIQQIREEINKSESEAEAGYSATASLLMDAIAKDESSRDQLEAALAALLAELPPEPEKE